MPDEVRTDLQIELPPEPNSVARARGAARDLALRVGAPTDDVALAVSEAVTNAVVHGIRRAPILLSAALEDDRLLVIVEDRAGGIRPNPSSSGLGFGMNIIKRVARTLQIEPHGDGTRVVMEFPRALT
jgi:anti-sigma regulatory factor (Ser/Thr protein kinase)